MSAKLQQSVLDDSKTDTILFIKKKKKIYWAIKSNFNTKSQKNAPRVAQTYSKVHAWLFLIQ